MKDCEYIFNMQIYNMVMYVYIYLCTLDNNIIKSRVYSHVPEISYWFPSGGWKIAKLRQKYK